MNNRDRKKKSTPGSVISVIIALACLEPELLRFIIPLAIFAGAVWLGIRAMKKGGSGKHAPRPRQKTTYLENCSTPLRYHRDKGDHYVRKGNGQDPWDNLGREIDPWDRPDIDIRKYQRNG